jgi:hypothetical protein
MAFARAWGEFKKAFSEGEISLFLPKVYDKFLI